MVEVTDAVGSKSSETCKSHGTSLIYAQSLRRSPTVD